MSDDILKQVRAEILKEDEKYLPWVPKHLDKTWEHQAGMAGAIAGMIAGFAIGSHMGLAGPWGAIAGTVPCTIIGGVVGYLGAAKIGSGVQRDKQSLLFNSNQSKQLDAPVDEPREQIGDDTYLNPSGNCHKCGRKKSSWWDSSKNRCSWCNSPALPKLQGGTSETPKLAVADGENRCPNCKKRISGLISRNGWCMDCTRQWHV